MKTTHPKHNHNLLKCELLTIAKAPLIVIFSFFFPILMFQILYSSIIEDIPEAGVEIFGVSLFISSLLIIPMALILMGFATETAEQRIQGVLRRMNLFGFSFKTMISYKILANTLMLLIAIAIFTCFVSTVISIPMPHPSSLFIFILALLLLTLLLFLAGSVIALASPNINTAISLSMVVYFAVMILSGFMGINPDTMPVAVQVVSKTLPTYYIGEKLPYYWISGGFNSGTLFLTLFSYISVCSVLLFIVVKRKGRRVA